MVQNGWSFGVSARLFLPGHAARRPRAQAEADRPFTMSPDVCKNGSYGGSSGRQRLCSRNG